MFAPLTQQGVAFTLEPTSLKACGCCTLDTNTSLYAIDDESFGHWNGHWGLNGVASRRLRQTGLHSDGQPGHALGHSPTAWPRKARHSRARLTNSWLGLTRSAAATSRSTSHGNSSACPSGINSR